MQHLYSFAPMRAVMAVALASIAGLPLAVSAGDATVSLKGDQEVPAVASPAEGDRKSVV